MTYSTAITPESPVTNSLIMEDEHLDTIPETESDELIKSSVEDLVQIPSESEDSSDGECDLPPYDDSSKNHDLTFSNPLFDIDEDFTSSDESFSEEDVPNENFKIFSNPLFDLDEEITSTKVDQSDDEIDSLLDEFAGELTLLHSIPPGIDDVNLDPEGDILFLESLLYDNSSPRPPEEFNSKNPTMSFSPSPIPVEDSDSLMEEIDIFLDGDGSIPPGIESDDYNLEDDDNSTSCPEDRNKIYDPGICIEVESTRFLFPLSLLIDTLLPFSSENDDKVFNHGVLAYKEKSPPSSSHRDLKALQLSPESLMLIHGDNTPNLGVRHLYFYPTGQDLVWGGRVKLSDLKQTLRGWQPMLILYYLSSSMVVMIAQIFEASRARGFVLRS
ncbi:hypothetical protein Tco_0625436 [Tanacetum coccineum]|uniref:Uncharacterized protein n=1 Tax=Tanacetum coccineum TaxID=301880 RepID=A0ABQ4WGT4_9ASTR